MTLDEDTITLIAEAGTNRVLKLLAENLDEEVSEAQNPRNGEPLRYELEQAIEDALAVRFGPG